MKRNITLLNIVLFLGCGFVSAQKLTTITVTLIGTKEAKAFLQKDQETISANSKTGVFKFEFPLFGETFFDFGCGNNSSEIYLEPGDNLVLNAVDSIFDRTLKYIGTHQLENGYLHQRNLKRKIFGPLLTQIRSYPERDYLLSLDSVIAAMSNDFLNYQKENKYLSKKFIKHENTNFSFIRVNQRGVFANNYKTNHTDGSVLSDGFSDYLKTLNYNDASFLPAPRFRDFLRNIRYNETAKLLLRRPEIADSANGNIKAMFMIADSLFTNQTIKNYSLYTTLRFELRQFGLAIPIETINEFYDKCTDKKYVTEIKDNYYIWTTLKKGNKAPFFTALDSSGKQISLKDFEGKFVYVDVWATWCAPCLQEMPALDSLVFSYKDNNEIVFLKVSIDANKQAWESKIKKDNLSEILNLWVENAANSDFAKAYAIKDIPRYVLIDKKGKLINSQAAAPSLIKNQIAKILKTVK